MNDMTNHHIVSLPPSPPSLLFPKSNDSTFSISITSAHKSISYEHWTDDNRGNWKFRINISAFTLPLNGYCSIQCWRATNDEQDIEVYRMNSTSRAKRENISLKSSLTLKVMIEFPLSNSQIFSSNFIVSPRLDKRHFSQWKSGKLKHRKLLLYQEKASLEFCNRMHIYTN